MAKKKHEFEANEVLDKIPKDWHPKKKKSYAVYEIKRTIDVLGVDAVNKSQLARKYNVEWHTIDRWYISLINATPKEQIDVIASKAELRINKAFERLGRMAADPSTSNSDKIAAEREIRGYIDSQIKILEAYGRKPKVADELNVKGEIKGSKFRIIERSKKEIQDAKNKRKRGIERNRDQSKAKRNS